MAGTVTRSRDLTLREVYAHHFGLSVRSILQADRDLLDSQLVDPLKAPAEAWLARKLGPQVCLRARILPWRRIGGVTIVLAPDAATFERHRAALAQTFGPVRLALSATDQITGALARDHGPALARAAECRLPAADSSRDWSAATATRLGLALLALMGGLFTLFPAATFTVLCMAAVLILVLNAALKAAAVIAMAARGRTAPPDPVDLPDRLPVITLLVPLYREREIATELLSRLERLNYPRACLDVCLVLEDNDSTTREALTRTRLMSWIRAITVPEGTLRTKPRALNYALDFARGSIVGVYDAEDAPDPDQLRVVAARFARAAPEVACLQGILDYYNSTANWLTRCFTIEYAGWFRVILPGIARLGFVVPLGGTTLFLRRDVLEKIGAWDAHNVTEDADLGIRLARRGYRTEFIPTVTLEEANGSYLPWIKQRSRWLKGYAITYAVHMRRPLRLWRDLGPLRFAGVQLVFLGTLAQFTLAPLLWSFWLILLGLPHPMAGILTPALTLTLTTFFVASEGINFLVAALGLRRAGKLRLLPWAVTLQAYFPLGSFAVYKGLLELGWKPFWWDKTAHGILRPTRPATPPGRRPASGG
ncbi:glycosyltransferase family 2 protein [Salipiger sp. IMCC34102]|uniref:glycosyltransferase family 2 protein n=1 Tax=Salipiger sp. IMCC34102 TaxID=2510647 RepID=UPI0013EC9A44|nr:glycosyltransferase family 2 protein [Salipiger sp. IMCC34102]